MKKDLILLFIYVFYSQCYWVFMLEMDLSDQEVSSLSTTANTECYVQ